MPVQLTRETCLPELAEQQFCSAVASAGLFEKHYLIADRSVRMRCAGTRLLNCFAPALAHREENREHDGHDDLTIYLWEGSKSPLRQSGDEWSRATTTIRKRYDDEWVYYQGDVGLLSWLTLKTDGPQQAFVCGRNVNDLPSWESAVPLRSLWNAWVSLFGGVFHGAAVGDDQWGVLLAGVGGSGKSSTALTCLVEPGLFHLGDDLCLLTNDEHPTVHSLYNSAKLLPENVGRFEDVSLTVREELPRNPEKETFFLHPQYTEKLGGRRPLRGILLPRVTGKRETRLVPARQSEAWRAVVPVSMSLLGGVRPESLKSVTDIIRALPAYHLELGTDRAGIAAVIRRFLAEGAIS